MKLKLEDISITLWSSTSISGFSLATPKGVRITHLPTGVVVREDRGRTPHVNRLTALKELECRLRSYTSEDLNTSNDFGWALAQLRSGEKVQRSGWNGKGIFIELQSPDENSRMTSPYIFIDTTGLQTDNEDAPKSRVPWLASQTDMLAEDWFIVERQTSTRDTAPWVDRYGHEVREGDSILHPSGRSGEVKFLKHEFAWAVHYSDTGVHAPLNHVLDIGGVVIPND